MKQHGIKRKELRKLFQENDIVEVILDDTWRIIQNKNSMLGDRIKINHLHNPHKWEEFNDLNKALDFFLMKIAANKVFRKARSLGGKIDINPNPEIKIKID